MPEGMNAGNHLHRPVRRVRVHNAVRGQLLRFDGRGLEAGLPPAIRFWAQNARLKAENDPVLGSFR